jgi:UDP-N-acetylglucosamine 1-carboxyvinyltransferase
MKWLEICGGAPIKGVVRAQGSKNSALALIVASCLAGEPVTIDNIPSIADIHVTCGLLRSTGAEATLQGNTLTVDPRTICNAIITSNKSRKVRIAYYFLGALLARHKRVVVGYPGGDKIGPRPMDQHYKGLGALGAKFTFYNDYYVAQADRLVGADVYFDCITCGATINVMLAAVLAQGRTVIHNAARDPEVVDVAVFLSKMGAHITGAGTDTVKIRGVESLRGCQHQCISDRILAGVLLMAAGVTHGGVKLTGAETHHLGTCIEKLREIGLNVSLREDSISAKSRGILRSASIVTGMYPLFATDYQQPATSLLLLANGKSTVTELVYPHRFGHCQELNRMGAGIHVSHNTAYIEGAKELHGADVTAADIRSGMSLILAGLSAKGTTRIFGVEHIERGFENIVESFSSLGAKLAIVSDVEEGEGGARLSGVAALNGSTALNGSMAERA